MRVRREIWMLIGILVVGAVLRGAYLRTIIHLPDFTAPGVDAGYHDYWARALITGKWTPPIPYADPLIRTTPFFRPPGYPYFLALIYLITGSSYLGARIAQMALGLLGALLAFLFGRRWFGSRMGLIFAGLMSVYWGFIYFEGEMVEPALVSILALLLIWVLSLWTEKATIGRSIIAGLLLGLSALVRPNVLLFGPAILIWAWWVIEDRRQFAIVSLGLILAAGLAISPATIRNYRAAHDFVPISSNAGINLLLGNNELATGGIATVVPGIGEFYNCYDYPRIVAAVEAKVGRPLKHSEVSAYLGAQAKEYIKTHPLDTLKLTWHKALMFWGPLEVGNNKEDEVERAHSTVLRRIPGNFALVSALFIAGFLTLIPERRNKKAAKQYQVSALVLLFIAAYFVSYLPYFAAGRFRMPLLPFLMFFGALGLDRMIRLATERNLKAAGLWLLVIIAAYGLATRNFSGYEPDVAKWHLDRAIAFGNAAKVDSAIEEYRAALVLKPEYPLALYSLGMQLTRRGKYDEAIDSFERALEIDPEDFRAHYGLGWVYSVEREPAKAMGEYQTAIRINPDFYPAHQELGMILLARKQVDQALSELSEAVRLKPDLGEVHAAIAGILEGQGKLDEAAEHYLAALSIQPTPMLHFRYAGLLVREGKFDEAAEQYQNAVRLNPRDPVLHFNLAAALQAQDKLDEAVEQYSEAIRLRPGYARAHKNLAVLLFFKKDYAGAWEEVELCRKYGGTPHPDFVKALAGKMPKP